ncbi:MAG: nicotinate (nicotinamide) nucleotide adenylyltransferase [Nitrospirae bacterium]|nr:MAG: nicotinate (nicotinamide) nucleotide adenylyltransferase [Nitrospirota bacterium]
MKLGLYGGAFNPIHRCHLVVAETARTRLGLDRVLFIPTGDPPHKPPSELMPAAHRLEMVRLAIAPFSYFQLSDIETGRAAKSYTIDSVRTLRASHPADTRFIFIIGLDAFADIASWREPERLLELCDFAVVSRPGCLFKSLEKLPMLGITDVAALERLDGGRAEAQEIRLKGGTSLWGLPIPPCNASAQDIRKRLTQRQSLENLLPAGVESYILRHNLFGGGAPQ